jgi:hypothetical protein
MSYRYARFGNMLTAFAASLLSIVAYAFLVSVVVECLHIHPHGMSVIASFLPAPCVRLRWIV